MNKEKTIREQIEDIKGDFCEMCCKHYEEAETKAAAYRNNGMSLEYNSYFKEKIQSKLKHDHCRVCPLNRL